MDPAAIRRLAALGRAGDAAGARAALARGLMGGLRAEQVHVLSLEADRGATAYGGDAQVEAYVRSSGEAPAWVAANGRPLIVDAERAAAGLGPEMSGRYGMRGALLLPLVVGDAPRAVVAVGGTEPRAWSPEDVEAAAALVDVAGLALALAERQAAARQDPMTGCLNAAGLHARLAEEVARALRNGSPLACLLFAVADLGEIAERHGPPVAEAVVRHVSAVLCGQFRATDQVARLRDDVFAVVLPDAPPPRADVAAQRALRLLGETRIATAAGEQELGVAMGIAEWKRPEDGPALLARAEAALAAGARHAR